MADTYNEDLDSTNQEDESVLDAFDASTDEEMEKAGDDPAKLKEIIKSRTETRQRLYARMKKAEAEAKANKPDKQEADKSKQQKGKAGEFKLGWGEKAYLTAKGVEEDDEQEIVEDYIKRTGEDLGEAMKSYILQGKLKELREEKANARAMPNKGTRGGNSAQNTVEYWIDKGTLPSDPKLARQVVAEKIRRDSSSNKFGGSN